MRKLLATVSLAGLLAVPAIAAGWSSELGATAERWDTTDGPQSEWRDEPDVSYSDPSLVEPGRPFAYAGDGWAALDGWMRGDPLLRQWVLRRFDLNGDTWLSATEAATARRAFYGLADANGSGIITRQEFLTGWMTVRAAMFDGYGYAPAG